MCKYCRADRIVESGSADPNARRGRVDILGQATARGLDVMYVRVDILGQQASTGGHGPTQHAMDVTQHEES